MIQCINTKAKELATVRKDIAIICTAGELESLKDSIDTLVNCGEMVSKLSIEAESLMKDFLNAIRNLL